MCCLPGSQYTRVVSVFLLVSVFCLDRSAAQPGEEIAGVPPDSAELGPTLQMSYSRDTFESNPISAFMYFVPLLSRTPVARETSPGNAQEVIIFSHERVISDDAFVVTCDFEIRGTGFHKNVFEPEGAIAMRLAELDQNEPISEALDYIKIEGAGLGRIVVRGSISGTKEIVEEVELNFKAGDQDSPVTIGIYDVEPVDGRYDYAQRSNERVARVNTLSFARGGQVPRMDISVASVRKADGKEGLLARIKGVVANFIINPPRIERLGNETVMRLGHALFQRAAEFTFPKAENLVDTRLASN